MDKAVNSGFSLLEIIIVLAIGLILIAGGASAFFEFRNSQVLNNAVSETVYLIKEARSKTLSSEDSSEYGVHFENSRIVFFKGTLFSESDPDNVEVNLSSIVEISNISLNNGVTDLFFKRLTGKTDQFGSVTLRIKSDQAKTKTINIKSTGIIDVD